MESNDEKTFQGMENTQPQNENSTPDSTHGKKQAPFFLVRLELSLARPCSSQRLWFNGFAVAAPLLEYFTIDDARSRMLANFAPP